MFKNFGKREAERVADNVVALNGAEIRPEPKPLVPDDPELMRYLELKSRLHDALLERLNLAVLDKIQHEELKREVATLVNEVLREEGRPLRAEQFKRLLDDLLHEVLGLGPLEPLLSDPSINDILVNGHRTVFVERNGVLTRSSVRFRDERHLLRIIDKIVSRIGRRVDESNPWVDARLEDGSRVNAIIRPCAIDGPTLSIRKFSAMPLTMDMLVEHDALSRNAALFLRAIVEARLNILISGGTGSGKTTMLNAMSAAIDNRERIVTIEDAAELRLQQDHVVRLETRPPNPDGEGAVMQRDLVRNALRMRPDRIIVGEVRGAEAFDMLQAMNTGHDGSMTTVHANSPRDALGRIEQMVTMIGNDFPMSSIRAQVASGLDIVLQLARLSDGHRRVVSVAEITGVEGEVISMQDIFLYRRKGKAPDGRVLGEFISTGIRPHCAERLEAAGVELPANLFRGGSV